MKKGENYGKQFIQNEIMEAHIKRNSCSDNRFWHIFTMTFSNVLLSDYVDLKSMFTANAATLNPVPVYYDTASLSVFTE